MRCRTSGLTVECLLAAGLTEFQVSVGQVDYFKSLLKEAELDTEAEERLRTLISQKNSFGVQEFVEEQKLKEGMPGLSWRSRRCLDPQMY